jgi:hypothetical protein
VITYKGGKNFKVARDAEIISAKNSIFAIDWTLCKELYAKFTSDEDSSAVPEFVPPTKPEIKRKRSRATHVN